MELSLVYIIPLYELSPNPKEGKTGYYNAEHISRLALGDGLKYKAH